MPSHRTEHRILSHAGNLSNATNITFKITSWPNAKSFSSVISSLPLLELSLHTNQTDFPSRSGSISFHNKNQFSVTLSSTVKVNFPHADIHIQISPSVTQHCLAHAPSASIQPTIKSLWIDSAYPQLNKINPHSHLLNQFPHPSWNLFLLTDHPVPPLIMQKHASTLTCGIQKLWSPPTSRSFSSFYSSFPLSYSLLPTGLHNVFHSPLPLLYTSVWGLLYGISF